MVSSVDRRFPRSVPALPVLTYHRIDHERPVPAFDPQLLSATPDGFAEHVHLLANDYVPLSMDALLEVRAGQRQLPPRAVLVTFDDAYVDFAEYAWPVLRRHGVPVTLFVPTSYPDSPDLVYWWDRLYRACTATTRNEILTPVGRLPLATLPDRQQASRLVAQHVKSRDHDEGMEIVEEVIEALGEQPAEPSVLGWSDLRTLAGEGVSLAAHSRTHAMLDRVGRERVVDEVVGSRRDLEEKIGHCPPVFCYPSGQHATLVEDVLEDHGFQAAFTTRLGINDLQSPRWLALNRINVSTRVTRTVLRVLLHPASAPLLRLLG